MREEGEKEKKQNKKSKQEKEDNGLQLKIWSFLSIIYCCITNFLKM